MTVYLARQRQFVRLKASRASLFTQPFPPLNGDADPPPRPRVPLIPPHRSGRDPGQQHRFVGSVLIHGGWQGLEGDRTRIRAA